MTISVKMLYNLEWAWISSQLFFLSETLECSLLKSESDSQKDYLKLMDILEKGSNDFINLGQ